MKKVVPFNSNLAGKIEEPEQDSTILPPLLSFQEVCDYLGLGHTIVSKMIQTGEISSTRARNRIRVFATDLRAYLEKNRKLNGSENYEENT